MRKVTCFLHHAYRISIPFSTWEPSCQNSLFSAYWERYRPYLERFSAPTERSQIGIVSGIFPRLSFLLHFYVSIWNAWSSSAAAVKCQNQLHNELIQNDSLSRLARPAICSGDQHRFILSMTYVLHHSAVFPFCRSSFAVFVSFLCIMCCVITVDIAVSLKFTVYRWWGSSKFFGNRLNA